jgi:uncharacterized protein
MAASPVAQSIDETRILPYATEPITEDKVLVTGYFGGWTFLSPNELQCLKEERINESAELYGKLRDSGIIINGENVGTILGIYSGLNRGLFRAPSLHMINVTNMCNNRCKYCHAGVSQGKDMMSLETADKVVDFIFRSASKWATIEFQGGECLLNWKVVRRVVEKARQMNKDGKRDIHICIVSNMLLMDQEKVDFLIENDVAFCTSLDGTQAIHDANRKSATGEDTFLKTVEKVKWIKEEFKKRGLSKKVDMLATITRTALSDPKGIIDTYLSLGTQTIHLRSVNDFGDALNLWPELSYSAEEFFVFWKQALDYIIELNRNGTPIMERGAYNILCKLLCYRDPLYVELMNPTGMGRSTLLYNFDGAIFSSDEGRMIPERIFQLGTIEQPVGEVLGSEDNKNTWASTFMDLVAYHSAFRPWGGVHPVHVYKTQRTTIPNLSRSKPFKIYSMQCKYLLELIARDGYEKGLFMGWTEKVIM